MDMDEGGSYKGVRAVEVALRVLETVAFSREPLGVTQIAGVVGVAKGAVFRHLSTLCDGGYLVQDAATNRYRLGPKAYLIGRLAPPTGDLASAAEGAMREAREQTGLAVVLSTPTARSAFVIATFSGRQPIEIGVREGSELALHASAQGKIFLAFGPKSLADRVLASPLPALTGRTITDPDALRQEIGRVRAQGWATAPEESLLGINTIAAPVFDHTDTLVAAAALVGSIQHIPSEPDEQLRNVAVRLAQAASRAIGHGMIETARLQHAVKLRT
ncbi:IclR family transcriptional regulator [Roseomonas sp. E05]|uniref:IclR family transcriptional regulator n=1 Tax=Roseomonas sp. E05 TaxID=3046310 RepID=UPI0024B8C313|nr:IclR family transcriptional regulator [Roseomonas sp. E05]MDJ0389551.1 IclR family transcriptional regulator [Roseomonas sp. E05]